MTADYEVNSLICDHCGLVNDLKELTSKGGFIPVVYNGVLLHFCTSQCMIEYSRERDISAKGESNEETEK